MLKKGKKVIVKRIKFCRSFLSKTIGLMFSKKIVDKCLIFVFDTDVLGALHMYFVFYPIDVLFLDKDKKVIEMKEDFKPFRVYHQKNKSRYIIELPAKTVKDKRIKIGDVLEF